MGTFRLTTALSDHMVLQREEPVRIWGCGAKEGQTVLVRLGSYQGTGIATQTGYWEAFLPAMPANTAPQTLTAVCVGETVTAVDVLIGDVWLVNGQSNADCTMNSANANGDGIYTEEMKDLPANVRAINQGVRTALRHPESMLTPQFDLAGYAEDGSWKTVEAEGTVQDMPAIGFFFAKKISRAFNGSVPLGIVNVSSGGSPVMELIPPELVAPMGYQKAEKANIPLAGIYNSLLAPVQPMTIKGMLYYQGESEQWRHRAFPYQLKWYVEELRRRFGKCFPFYHVQLSSHIGPAIDGWKLIEEVRYEQTRIQNILENTRMIVSMDVGGQPQNHDWAHPPYKKPVGERLADVALAREYNIGKENFSLSPVPTSWRFDEDKITVHFQYVGEGLRLCTGEKPLGFEIAGVDGKYRKATARITDKNTMVFRGVKAPAMLRYGNSHDAKRDLFNLASSTDYPMAAFELLSPAVPGTATAGGASGSAICPQMPL